VDKYLEMRTFAAVVDEGSFVAAADVLEMSKPAVSRHVGELEARLGVRLLHRTTRKLSLTDEGTVFHARCKELLGSLDEAEAEITARSGRATGRLKINAPVSFGISYCAPLWGAFLAKHPGVRLEVDLSDRMVELVDEGYDLAIRIARLPSSTLVFRQLASTRLVLCASPQYLKKKGKPKHPSELTEHDAIGYSNWSAGDRWGFTGSQGEVSVKIRSRFYANNGETCVAVARAHGGVILQPSFLVSDAISSKQLIELMPAYQALTLGIYAVYPSRRHISPKVRAMIDFLVEQFKQPRWMA
jgi:DNA-binding transcriptional LysR family regulator